MRAGRDMDKRVSQEVMGYSLNQQKREFFETTAKGTRPLRSYSTDMAAAWEVVEKMGITLIPIEGGEWFAMVGPKPAWSSPAEFIQYLSTGKFAEAGAAVGTDAAHVICVAALNASLSRQAMQGQEAGQEPASNVHH